MNTANNCQEMYQMSFLCSLLQYQVFVLNCYVLTSRTQVTIEYLLTTNCRVCGGP